MGRAERSLLWTAMIVGMLACGPGEDPPAERGRGAPAVTVAASEPEPEDAQQPADFSNCPARGEPREISVPATGTRIRWCERRGPGGVGIRHGPFEKLRNGVVVERGPFADGVRHGRWTLHWSGGARQSEGEYLHGRRSGVWSFWREDGSLIRRQDYSESEDEGTDVAKPVAEGEEQITLEIDNNRATRLIFKVDAFGEAWSMPPGARFEVYSRGPNAARIGIEADEESLTVRPAPGTETRLLSDGVELPQ